MFGIGFGELLIIGIVALVFLGPDKMPQVARQLGKFFVQFRRMTSDVKAQVDQAIRDAEAEVIREEREKLQKLLATNAVNVEAGMPPEGTQAAAHPMTNDSGSDVTSHGNDGHGHQSQPSPPHKDGQS